MVRNSRSTLEPASEQSVTEEARSRTGTLATLPIIAPAIASPPLPAAVATAASEGALWDWSFPRCSIKGCIFPAASAQGTLCLLHDLAEREPNHFLSVQPSTMCLDRAKYGIAETEYDNSRARDRRALALQLDRFRNEVA